MSSTTAPSRPTLTQRGFTLVEVLFSVLIIGVLVGLLIVGFRSSRSFASSVGSRTAVANIKSAVAKFSAEFGFVPPLVCERALQAGTSPTLPHPASSSVMANGANRAKFAVYDFSRSASNPDRDVLMPAALTPATAANPFLDERFSERTIAYYLVGACNTQRDRGSVDLAAQKVPIDGVVGPGFYPPNPDGTFKVPADVADPSRGGTVDASSRTRRAGAAFESFIDLSGKGVTMAFATPVAAEGQAAADPDGFRAVSLVDSKGVPIRYYRWLNPDVMDGLEDFRLPPLVGRANSSAGTYPYPIPPDRDIEKNAALRDATYAIVAAGPDGAFGDEPDALLLQRLNRTVPADQIQRLRFEAEKDNIVEVGK